MRGKVVAGIEPVVPIVIVDGRGQTWEIDCIVDTACTADLTLPSDAIAAIDLPWIRFAPADIAGRNVLHCNRYEATILWNGGLRKIEVVELEDDPLIGMLLLDGYRLSMEICDGGDVEITPLTEAATE